MIVDSSFWKNKRVFLTGHTGFKGSWLALWLERMGAQVTGYALAPPTNPSLFDKARVAQGIESITGNICDADSLCAAAARARPEIVIHMAAQPLVRYSYANPVETYSTNVMGTLSVLEAVRKIGGVKSVVIVTTDKCYENREWAWGYREIDALGGYDPYSSSKACTEILSAAYRQSYFHPDRYAEHGTAVATVRAGNVIGGGDWALDRLVPDCIAAYLRGEDVVIRSPKATRPWQHVLEPLSGYLCIAQHLFGGTRHAKAWNFGPADSDVQPVEAVVRLLFEKLGAPQKVKIDAGARVHEAGVLKLDCSQARTELGWVPVWTLDTALDRIAQWVSVQKAEGDLRAVTLKQIDEYAALRA